MAFQFTHFHHQAVGLEINHFPYNSVFFLSNVDWSDLFVLLLHSCLASIFCFGFSVSMWLFGTLGNARCLRNCIFVFHILSCSFAPHLCLSLQCNKTSQPPSHGCHSNRLPTLTLCVNVCLCMYILDVGMCVCVGVYALKDVTYWKCVPWTLVLPP